MRVCQARCLGRHWAAPLPSVSISLHFWVGQNKTGATRWGVREEVSALQGRAAMGRHPGLVDASRDSETFPCGIAKIWELHKGRAGSDALAFSPAPFMCKAVLLAASAH
jgi:hypothetical protein